MWGKSKKRIAELEAKLDEICLQHATLYITHKSCDAKITQLVRDVREMDQLVYQMVQTVEPSVLRSALARAWAITEARMKAESKRIEAVLIPKIIKTYIEPTTQQLERKQ